MDAGKLDHRAVFASRGIVDTDMGGSVDQWIEHLSTHAAVKYLRGTESVMQARLASRNPVVVTIRNSARARQITSDWRVTLRSRSGVTKEYQVKEDPRPIERDAYLEMLCEG